MNGSFFWLKFRQHLFSCFVVFFLFVFHIFFSDLVFANLSKDVVIDDLRKQYLQKVLTDYPVLDSKDIKVDFLTGEQYFVPPLGSESYIFKFLPESDVLGRTILPLSFVDKDSNLITKVNVITDIKATKEFVCAVKTLKKGKVILNNMVKLKRLDFRGRSPNSCYSINDVLNKVPVSTLGKGTIITESMIKLNPVVKKHEHVSIFVKKKAFELTINGVALDEGGVGETIRVRTSLGKGKILKGEIIDSESVKVSLFN